MKTKDMIFIDGQWVCPKCHERKFKELRVPHSYMTILKDCDVTNDGRFKFVYVCANCNLNIVEYDNLKRRLHG